MIKLSSDGEYSGVADPKKLWEILVPTEMQHPSSFDYKKLWAITTRYHRVWDAKVREITGGMTILRPAVGQWINDEGQTFIERMIPVRLFCSQEDIEKIADFTAEHYKQEAIMYYVVSSKVVIKNYSVGPASATPACLESK